MRVIILLVAWWMLAPLLFAQSSNKPVSLALVMENSAASLAGDLLTTELSGQETFQLLERTEIDKIYREQAVSVGNQNYLRLGQLLGADGLLLLKGVKEGDTEFLAVRLVAIKPGVVIRETRLPWHQAEALAEAKWIATYFRPFFTKLAVSPRDAIPLSIVNLRSAMKSSESETLERQLSLLLTRRLSQQRELFVLERRRMDLVTAETELQGIDETPFWNGSYLLDGVIDRDGYSKEILTIHARLSEQVRQQRFNVSRR